ncbi:MAG: SPASM domain-containing protein, partial [Candidatus Thermoplasmatota archaeon]|nr:SPASM domain-containing protein [Candidatus Thermoplasmatota archaeon]
KMGNLKRQRLEEIWTSNEFKLFRKKFVNAWKLLERKVPCSACICKDDCYGICPAMAFQKAGNMVIPGDLCCRLYKEERYRWIITEGWSSKDS